MFEHVGKKFYPVFFKKVKELLKPKGIGLLETVGSYEDKSVDKWITKYIFPEDFTPTLSMITEPMSKNNLVFLILRISGSIMQKSLITGQKILKKISRK